MNEQSNFLMAILLSMGVLLGWQFLVTEPRLAAERAQAAFGASNLDERGYVDLVSNRFAKEQDIMTLELALLDRQIALQTLVGDGLPAVETGTTAR